MASSNEASALPKLLHPGLIAVGAALLIGALAADHKTVRARPVGVALDRTGALLVADDVGNVVWRVSATGARPGA